MDSKILNFVKKVRGRLKEQTVIDGIMISVVIGLSLSLVVLISSLWISMYYAIPISVGMVLLSFAVGIVVGIRKAPTLEQAALRADAKGYKEKFVTALMLVGKDDAFSRMQKQDAVKNMEVFQIKKEFPIRLSLKKCLVLTVLVLVFGITAMLDTPAKRLAITMHDVKKDSLAEIEKLERLKKEISKVEKLSDKEKTEIKEQIDLTAQEMRTAKSYEELKKAEDIITKKLEMKAANMENVKAKNALEKTVSDNKASQAKKVENAMKEAESAMKNANSEDEKDKRDAYEKLNKLAEISGNDALKKVAENYKKSDYSNSDYLAANQALQDAKDEMKKSDIADNSGNPNGQQENQNSGQQSNQSQNGNGSQQGNQSQNGNSGQQSNQSQNGNSSQQGNQSQNGNSGQQGNQSQNGNNAQQSNQNQNGNGSQNGDGGQNGLGNTGSGNGSGNGNGNGSGPGWNRGSKNGSERGAKTNEDVTIPDGSIGDDDNLSGKANGNGSSIRQKSSQADTWAGNKVSYGQVSGEYKEKAYKKVDGSNYPGKMKEKIRDYFDGLD